MHVGVVICGTLQAGLLVPLLGFLIEFLAVGQVDAGLAGAVVSDEVLQAYLYGVRHGGGNERVLVGDIDGDDHGLIVNVAYHFASHDFHDSHLLLGQAEGVDLGALFRFLVGNKGGYPPDEFAGGTHDIRP